MGRAFEFRKARKLKRWSNMAKTFTRIGREIVITVKEGGPDPSSNSRLRAVIQNAKNANMPKDNIERAIDKSSATTGTNFESLRYEGFGPEKVAVIVDVLTDNKNRTASNIRTIFQKCGGSFGTQGSASHNFNQLGIIKINKNEISDEDILELAIEAGADECRSNHDYHEIQCQKSEIYNVKKELEKKINNFISTEIEWIPFNSVQISKERTDDLVNFFETLEEDDDVQNIYSNAKFLK